jgi:hypothetical protein
MLDLIKSLKELNTTVITVLNPTIPAGPTLLPASANLTNQLPRLAQANGTIDNATAETFKRMSLSLERSGVANTELSSAIATYVPIFAQSVNSFAQSVSVIKEAAGTFERAADERDWASQRRN